MSYFIGIDQTGAVDTKGLPKKLSASIIIEKSNSRKIYLNLNLNSLTLDGLRELFAFLNIEFFPERTFICVDSVLGFNHKYNLKIRDVIAKAKNYSYQNKTYGANTAHQFFQSLIIGKPQLSREIELKLGANSVFNLKPYQKNIGCGTYRILKELSLNQNWYTVWPFESQKKNKVIICEGYPSYSWKRYAKINKRNLNEIQKTFPKLKFMNQDFADSFILAWTIMKNKQKVKKKMNSNEGWILGV